MQYILVPLDRQLIVTTIKVVMPLNITVYSIQIYHDPLRPPAQAPCARRVNECRPFAACTERDQHSIDTRSEPIASVCVFGSAAVPHMRRLGHAPRGMFYVYRRIDGGANCYLSMCGRRARIKRLLFLSPSSKQAVACKGRDVFSSVSLLRALTASLDARASWGRREETVDLA